MAHRPRWAPWLALAASLLAGGCGVTKTVHRTFPLALDGRIVLEGATGDTSIRAWDYDEVSIDAFANAKDADGLQAADIRFEAEPARVRIWTEFLDATDEDARSGLIGSGRARVGYDLTVPRQARLEDIRVRGGRLEIENVTGDIAASVDDGSIEARFERLTAGQSVTLEARSGSITVVLPEELDVRIEARARNGSVESTIGIPLRNALPGGGTEGTLEEVRGAGATRIRLDTVDGNIRIRTAR